MTFGQENPGLPTRRWTERSHARVAARQLAPNAFLSLSSCQKYSGEREGQRRALRGRRGTRRNRPSWKDCPGDVSIAIPCKRMFFQHQRFQAFVEDVAVTDVAAPFAMSLAAISKQLGVLTRAGFAVRASAERGTGDQPGPRPTLPPGGRIAALRLTARQGVFGAIKRTNPACQSAHPGSGATLRECVWVLSNRSDSRILKFSLADPKWTSTQFPPTLLN